MINFRASAEKVSVNMPYSVVVHFWHFWKRWFNSGSSIVLKRVFPATFKPFSIPARFSLADTCKSLLPLRASTGILIWDNTGWGSYFRIFRYHFELIRSNCRGSEFLPASLLNPICPNTASGCALSQWSKDACRLSLISPSSGNRKATS